MKAEKDWVSERVVFVTSSIFFMDAFLIIVCMLYFKLHLEIDRVVASGAKR